MATASAATVIQQGGQLMTVNDFQALLTAGTDEVFKRGFDAAQYPFQGNLFYVDTDLNKSTRTSQTTVGMGNMPRNPDGGALEYDSQQQGFSNTMSSVIYRKAASWTRELIEDELYGQLTDNSEELMQSSRRTVEEIMADGINRALGGGGAAPFICEDGMYLIDADRPNPHARAGLWSNLEATGALTPSAIFTAQLNFRQNTDARGNKQMLRLVNIIVRPDEEKTMWEILNSPQRPYDSQNAHNFEFQRYEGKVYDHMTTAQVIYKAEGAKNELLSLWRTRPGVADVETGDPDVFAVRARMRFGIGCDRPTVWRGGALS